MLIGDFAIRRARRVLHRCRRDDSERGDEAADVAKVAALALGRPGMTFDRSQVDRPTGYGCMCVSGTLRIGAWPNVVVHLVD
jgi:hypothetical protein